MANLVELYDLVIQAQAINGVPLSHGHVYVYALGRTKLMDTWSDIDGESLNPNPVILDNAGQAHIYVSDDFDYTLVFTDEYDNEIFSVDKYLLSKGEHSHADVAVAPSEHIGVSSYHVGEVTVYVPYLTGEVGKVYEGIDPIVVNNDVNRISANHIPLGVQDPLYFVEDSETACIIGCSAQTEIPAELSGKWDEASDAVIANSAQWAEGTEYEAGSYVDIDGHTISVTGLQPEGDYAYNSALSSKLDVTALPQDLVHSGDLTAYYPIDNPSGFITGVDLTDYATTAQLDEKLDKSDSGNFYPMEGNPSGFLTAHQSLQGYATEQWVEDKGYLTGVDIPESATWNATTQTVSANSAQWAGGTANPQIPVTGINGIKISESGDKVVFEVSANYATEDWVTGQGYLTAETDWTNTITAASANAYNEATAAIPTGLATTGDLANVSADITAQIPTDLFTKASADTLYQPIGNYLTTGDSANFATTGDVEDLITSISETYQTTAGMTAYLTTGDSAEFMTTAERSDYIPTGVSSEFYTTANTAGYISEVPDTYLQNTDLSTEDGKVTAISGIPLSAGGDVPEGVMVESGLEYNAVNEISGYNGSAIAQYGAEKQWLVHDDTLVHAANSAQYALGCNISALQRLMGIDETVLYSGNSTAGVELSEDPTNFNYLRIDYGAKNSGANANVLSIKVPAGITNYGFSHLFKSQPNSTVTGDVYKSYSYYSGCNTTTWVKVYGTISPTPFTTITNNAGWTYIYKIVGIGRKEV